MAPSGIRLVNMPGVTPLLNLIDSKPTSLQLPSWINAPPGHGECCQQPGLLAHRPAALVNVERYESLDGEDVIELLLESDDGMHASSVLKKRRRKMNHHKYKKLRKRCASCVGAPHLTPCSMRSLRRKLE